MQNRYCLGWLSAPVLGSLLACGSLAPSGAPGNATTAAGSGGSNALATSLAHVLPTGGTGGTSGTALAGAGGAASGGAVARRAAEQAAAAEWSSGLRRGCRFWWRGHRGLAACRCACESSA